MATSTLGNGTLVLAGTTSGTTTVTATAVAGTTTLTLPAATDTLVGKATTDTLTNKTLTGAAMNGTLGATTPSTVAATTLTTSSTVTHNGGTANGVPYLNGSKVLTTGSDLVFDGTNLGVGVTPSAWQSYTAFQMNAGSILSYSTNDYRMVQNSLRIGGAWKYINNGFANAYLQDGSAGAHAWFNAASGTAGNPISFTQAMTLDASGNLGIGTTSPNARITVKAAGNGYTNGALALVGSVSGTSYITGIGGSLYFSNNGSTDHMVLDSSGQLLVGAGTANTRISAGSGQFSTSSGLYIFSGSLSDNSFLSRSSSGTGTTTWYIGNAQITTVSDVRLKENIIDTQRNALEILGQLRVVDHTWNDPSDQCKNNRNSRGTWMGLIAQEAQPVIPWLVNKPTADVDEEGNPQYWHMDYGYSVPLLVKAIQEQQALITTLTARITALESA